MLENGEILELLFFSNVCLPKPPQEQTYVLNQETSFLIFFRMRRRYRDQKVMVSFSL